MKNRQLFTQLFWLDAIERAIATFCEVIIGYTAVVVIGNYQSFIDTNWISVLLFGGFTSLLSIVKSVYAAAKADTDTASFTVDTKPLVK